MSRKLASRLAAAAALLLVLPSGAMGGEYLVYFGFERDNVTEEAAAVLLEVRYAAVSAMTTKIIITGHCDTAEASPDRLSMTRAQNVAAHLREGGLDASIEIETRAGGTKVPAVKSPPRTKNAENRRVVIEFQ